MDIVDTSDLNEILDLTDILNTDPNTFLLNSSNNDTLSNQSPVQTDNFNRINIRSNNLPFQNHDSSYSDSLNNNNYNHIINSDNNINNNSYTSNGYTNMIQNSSSSQNQSIDQNMDVMDDFNEFNELDELNEISKFLVDDLKPESDRSQQIQSKSPLYNNNSNNIYIHSNNHINFNSRDLNSNTSNSHSPISPDYDQPSDSNLIDDQLLTEIESLINKGSMHDNLSISSNTANSTSYNNSFLHSPLTPSSTSFNSNKVSKPETPKHHNHLVKKPSIKRLQTNIAHSPSTKRISKSPVKNMMAQTAAVVATNSSSSKGLSDFQRPESAKAAARAVQNKSLTSNKNTSPKNKIYSNTGTNSQPQKPKIRQKSRLSTSKSIPNLSYKIANENIHASSHSMVSSNQPIRGFTSENTILRSPSLNAIFDNDNMSLTKPPSLDKVVFESPLRSGNRYKLKSASFSKIKPSSCSIYSSATINSAHTNVSNLSNGSTASKTSASSKGSGMFDIYNHLPTSSDTLETIVSMKTSESSSDRNHQFSLASKDRTNHYVNYKSQQQQQQQSSSNFPKILPRENGSLSTRSESSSTSLNNGATNTFVSTPSPISAGTFASNTTFTPPQIVTSNNYRNPSYVPSDMDLISLNGSPLTPVSRTALKFEQLTTRSPTNSNGIKSEFVGPPIRPKVEMDVESIPKLSVWKNNIPTVKKEFDTFIENDPTEVFHKPQSQHKQQHDNNFYKINSASPTANFISSRGNSPSKSSALNSQYPPRLKTLNNLHHMSRNSVQSIHSIASTNSTISNLSTQDDASSNNNHNTMLVSKESTSDEIRRRNTDGGKLVIDKSGFDSGTNNSKNKHSNGKSKSSKDAAFRNLITTFNKKEPESYKPKVYSNMMQGLVEFQVKMSGNNGNKTSKGSKVKQ